MKDKNKQFAVIGLGRFGSSIATTLYKLGYEVLAIDANEEQVQKLSETVTHVVQADTTDENSLKALGIRNFDVVVVAIGEDIQANVLTTLILKDLGVKYIVAKARNELHGKMLAKIGADRIVYPERDMGLRVAHNLVSTNVLEYIELSPDLSIAEITAPKTLVGRSLAEANLRVKYEINVVAIKRDEVLIVPPPSDEKIRTGDILIFVGQTRGIQKMEELE
ncbi:potassium channel family protein [Sporomusa acidovorans]|uniref:Ktr system potassium uptake protein A n=1 Tax=Sporomusa acidovorans (strain ATCC 49682 / DSM 3132 / Mol) TaxID=1123286 RepID=A0ABZ3J3M8_SPOA4|nr:TrkA family potassium uptake protein [Sporomusa acidovorans]OZC20919.1 Ktr system potassium uptake protein A [Sporomusa acidovorans DSM 3132]SDE61031.1 trk system potassium uptake protein TrkA [Sporomusa acidovorans]